MEDRRRADKEKLEENSRIGIAAVVARDQKAEKKVQKQAKEAQETTVSLISWMLDIHTDSVKKAKEY